MNFVANIPCCIIECTECTVVCLILICKQKFIYLSLEAKAPRIPGTYCTHPHKDVLVLQGIHKDAIYIYIKFKERVRDAETFGTVFFLEAQSECHKSCLAL